ncbi:MFS transporter [Psychroflexus planctonicus]|uniref:MFS transporter n=1 Tax=Psychroflexus planctonicus TaxID=1526575 RepID=A0ABQ1SKP1_9FLAO|nr:MFS transporter [Psychroflexus planctonicus]GGE44020.1 MFS transporter [Psychroflexus planctonicus]
MAKPLPKGHSKLIRAWAFYDWANSVYSLVISSAIFPIFYGALTLVKNEKGQVIDDQVEFLGFSINNDSLISYVTAFAFVCISILSPLLSGIADYIGNKRVYMKFFNYLGAFSCIGLNWFNLENIEIGLTFYFFGLIGFWGSIVFYNSYLPDIAYKNQQDKASALGFSLGYIGSVLLLLLCLAMIMNYETFGFEDTAQPTRLSFVLTGIWWIGFSQYSYVYLPKSFKKNTYSKEIFFNGFKEIKQVFNQIKSIPTLHQYLGAFFVYSMAVQTIMLVATYFGIEEINWSGQDETTGLIISILLIQLVAIAGAYIAARLATQFGNILVLIYINSIWVCICVYAFFMKTPTDFYIAAFFVGLVMGAIQSLSRSTYAKLLPETKETTSFFSFYDVTEKIGIVFSMSIFGIISQLTDSMRNSVIFLAVFFGIGIFLLIRIPKLARI